MRLLRNTLYITSPDAYLSLDGENAVVQREGSEVGRFPFHNLENIVVFGYTGASPALMGKCAKEQISLTFLSMNGRFLARVIGKSHGNVLLRKKQYFVSEDSEESTKIAKNFIIGKMYNCRAVIERALRDYSLRLDIEQLRKVSLFLKESIVTINQCQDLEEIRGHEGRAAATYFAVLDELILQQKKAFYFKERSKRPPLDNFNALLSFAYTMLAGDVTAALESVGLDACVGFLHQDRPGRSSLALDAMEELRPIMADRFVLTCVNKKIITAKDFLKQDNGAIKLTDDGRRKFLHEWQCKKQEVITHPFIKEKMEWGLIPYMQATILARYLREDLDGYAPFLWK